MSRLTSYAYDLSGNIVEKSIANGTKEARTHDGRNRVSTLDNQTSGGGNIAGYAYSYDATGNVMEVEETYPSGSLSNRTITNTYDGVYRLLTEEIETTGGGTVTTDYAYDKGHNRTSRTVAGDTTTYEIGDGSNGAGANQIVSEETDGLTTTYEYDGNGNRSFRSIPPGGLEEEVSRAHESSPDDSSSSSSPSPVNTSYAYDDENRLIALDDDETGTYAYAYDYRTRRVIRVENGTTTNLVFNGGTSIIEYTSSVGSPTVEYVRGHDYGGGVGGLEYSVRSSTPSFNFYDSRGDVTTKTNGSGTVSFQTAYEAFGNQTVTSGSTSDRQMANTKEQDPTGLLNEGFRYRDPSTGTFLTRDPLGFKDGLNQYTYVRQNPWTHFDPEGLSLWDAIKENAHTAALGAGALWADTGGRLMGGHGSGLTAANYGHVAAVTGVGIAVGVAVAAALPEVAGATLIAGAARVAATGLASASGGAAAQATSNVLSGQPITHNLAQATATAAVLGAGLQAASATLGAARAASSAGAPAASAKGVVQNNATVGRWMSTDEYNKTVSTGTVQESRTGTTHVTSPANPSVYKPTAPPGSVHAQFDVPATSVKPTSASGVAKIIGPNSLEGRLAASRGQPVPQMPPASNIKITDNKPPVKPVQQQPQSH